MRNLYIVAYDVGVLQSLEAMLYTYRDINVRCFAGLDRFWHAFSDLPPGSLILDTSAYNERGFPELERLTRDAPSMCVIVLGDFLDIAQTVALIKAGALDVIEKPFKAETLLTAVEKAFSCVSEGADQVRASTADNSRHAIAALSTREAQVLTRLLAGSANVTVASDLDISLQSVEINRAHVMEKLGVRNIAGACGIAFRAGLWTDIKPIAA